MKPLIREAVWMVWVSCAMVISACPGPNAPDTRVADEATIREADAASIRAIAAKQIDATVSFYDDQASILMPNAPIVTGKEQIRKAWEQMFAVPGFNLVPKTTRIEVSRSGDLAYARGTYEFSAGDPSGKPVSDRGKFVVVWKKQRDGAWRIVADIWNSDSAPAPAAKQ